MKRDRNIKKLKNDEFDLLVIGGGISGCGIALDAVSRGLTVALIESRDFASGTSSKSTKLVHGGLRYLKQLDFGLVSEVGKERAIVHKNAPHLVHPEKMLLPILKDGTYGKWITNIGLRIYDYLADVEGDDRMKMLSKSETLQQEPLLSKKRLVGGALYAEYRTDDSRLTVSVCKTASDKGAVVSNYLEVLEYIYQDKLVGGVKVKDQFNGEKFEIKAKKVINATGPWADKLREMDGPIEGKRVFLSKGVHIVVNHNKFPIKQTAYFDGNDGRMIFAIPRQKVVYIGTTDTEFEGDPRSCTAENTDIEYLLEACNCIFPKPGLKKRDVISTWAGVRPLINEEGKDPTEMSRKDEVFVSDSGLVTIAGGKLTGYRKMAQRAVNKALNNKSKKSATKNITISGGNFENYKDVNRYIQNLTVIYQKELKNGEAKDLVYRHGKNAAKILEHMHDTGSDVVISELLYCMENEMCMTALDFADRRTGMVLFEPEYLATKVDKIIKTMKKHYNWNEERSEKELKSVVEIIKTN